MKRQIQKRKVLLVKVITQITRKGNTKNKQIDNKMILTAKLRKRNSYLHNKSSGRVAKSVVKPTLGTRGFPRVRREFSVLAEAARKKT